MSHIAIINDDVARLSLQFLALPGTFYFFIGLMLSGKCAFCPRSVCFLLTHFIHRSIHEQCISDVRPSPWMFLFNTPWPSRKICKPTDLIRDNISRKRQMTLTKALMIGTLFHWATRRHFRMDEAQGKDMSEWLLRRDLRVTRDMWVFLNLPIIIQCSRTKFYRPITRRRAPSSREWFKAKQAVASWLHLIFSNVQPYLILS